MKKSWLKYKRPAFIAALLAIIALPVLSYFYYRASDSSIEFAAAAFASNVKPGEEIDIRVYIKNNSKNPLQKIDLIFNLPEGIASESGARDKIQRKRLGDIGPGGEHEEIATFIALPVALEGNGSSEKREIQASIGYALGNLTANFVKSQAVEVEVENFPLEFNVIAPEEVVAGTEFEVVADYKHFGEVESPEMKLIMDYPAAFKKTGSAPKPDSGENAWVIKPLSTGEAGKITLKGNVDLSEGEKLSMTARLIIKIAGKDYAVFTKPININVGESPLSLELKLEDDKLSYRPGETINYKISYQNNTDIPLENIKASLRLTGEMYDFASLQATGAMFTNATKTVVWDSASVPALSKLDPLSAGELRLSLKLIGNYPIKKLNDKNFSVRAEARIESPTVLSGVSAAKTVNSTSLNTKIAGNIVVEAKALYRDADSLILNAGSLPPKVGAPTEFTIHWVLTNYATDVTNVEVRAKLEPGVVFTDEVKGNTAALPQYDKDSNEVRWQLDKVFATTGITGEKLEVIFQVRATPASNMIGSYMPLLGETKVEASDDFTGFQIVNIDPPLTTRLEDDASVQENQGKVIF